MRLLLDTNILIDYFGRRDPYYQDTVKLLVMQAVKDVELWSSSKSYTNVFYALRRAVPALPLQRAFAESFERIKPCSIDQDLLSIAAKREWNDFEDALVAACAERVQADFLITRDKTGFAKSKVPALSPQEFLDMIQRDYGFSYDVVDF